MNEDLMISGSWINKRTGQKVTIRNSIIDGDSMILITDKGQLSMEEFSNNYIQVSDEIYDENNNVIGKSQVNNSEIITDNYFDSNDSIYMSSSNNSKIEKPIIANDVQPKIVESEPQSYKILEKFFNKIQNKEDLVKLDINFNILPKSELKTIIEYLDVSLEDLSNYISNNIISTETISKIIFNKLNDEYYSNLTVEE